MMNRVALLMVFALMNANMFAVDATKTMSNEARQQTSYIDEAKAILEQSIEELKNKRLALKEELCINCITAALREAKAKLNGRVAGSFLFLGIPLLFQINDTQDLNDLISTLEQAEADKALRLELEDQLQNLQNLDTESTNALAIKIIVDALNKELKELKAKYCCQSLKWASAKKESLEKELATVSAWIQEIEKMIQDKKALKKQIADLVAQGASDATINEQRKALTQLDANQRTTLMRVACVNCKKSALSLAQREAAQLKQALAENESWIKEVEIAHARKVAIIDRIKELKKEAALIRIIPLPLFPIPPLCC